MTLNGIEFKDWLYSLFVIFTIIALAVNTWVNLTILNKRLSFDYKTKRANEFRENYAHLLACCSNLFISKLGNKAFTVENYSELIFKFQSYRNLTRFLIKDSKQEKFQNLTENMILLITEIKKDDYTSEFTKRYNKLENDLYNFGIEVIQDLDFNP